MVGKMLFVGMPTHPALISLGKPPKKVVHVHFILQLAVVVFPKNYLQMCTYIPDIVVRCIQLSTKIPCRLLLSCVIGLAGNIPYSPYLEKDY